MTIIAACKVAEGMVVAADSRLTIVQDGQTVFASDNDTKLFHFHTLPVGIMTCGSRAIANRPISSWVTDFIRQHVTLTTVQGIAEALSQYLPPADLDQITVLIAGYDAQATSEQDGRIFTVNVSASQPTEVLDDSGFIYRLDGDFDAVTRLLEGRSYRYVESLCNAHPDGHHLATAIDKAGSAKNPVPLYALSLRDGIELMRFWLRTQIDYQRFSSLPQTCGGPIDIATISPDGFRWIECKSLDAGLQ